MRNLLKILSLVLFLFSTISSVFAETTGPASATNPSSEIIKVKVTEKIPGAGCSAMKDKNGLYECSISPGFNTIQAMIGQIIKWFTALAALAGVLFIVINGILLSAGGDAKAKVKERIIKGITGMILLLLSGLILSMIAPWVYR